MDALTRYSANPVIYLHRKLFLYKQESIPVREKVALGKSQELKDERNFTEVYMINFNKTSQFVVAHITPRKVVVKNLFCLSITGIQQPCLIPIHNQLLHIIFLFINGVSLCNQNMQCKMMANCDMCNCSLLALKDWGLLFNCKTSLLWWPPYYCEMALVASTLKKSNLMQL